MKLEIQKMNKKNLHHIKNIEELRAEILATKKGIKFREKELAKRWERMPAETFKSAAGALASTFLSNNIAVKSFQLVKAATQKIFGKNKIGETKNNNEIFSSAKKIGLYTALGLFLKWLKKK